MQFRSLFIVSALISLFPITGAQAEGDPVLGKRQFTPCLACHTVEEGGPNKVGPNLWGVIGSKAGSREDYVYSPALKDSGVVWTEENLRAWIERPMNFIKGTKMPFGGYASKDIQDNVIAYLKEATQ